MNLIIRAERSLREDEIKILSNVTTKSYKIKDVQLLSGLGVVNIVDSFGPFDAYAYKLEFELLKEESEKLDKYRMQSIMYELFFSNRYNSDDSFTSSKAEADNAFHLIKEMPIRLVSDASHDKEFMMGYGVETFFQEKIEKIEKINKSKK